MDSSSFNNFFQQQLWNSSGGGGSSNKGREIASSDKNAMSGQSSSSSSSSSSSLILAPSKLAQSQPPHSTNRDLSTISLDNRLYHDGFRHHHSHHQQQQARHGGSNFSNGSNMSIALTTSNGGVVNSRDNNNNGVNAHAMGFASQKLLNRLDIDAIRSNVNRSVGNLNNGLMHHQHGTILFNTLNGGLNSGGLSDCFNSSDYGHPDSTTPPPATAISMPPPASSASSSSSTISTNIGLNRNSNGSQDGNPEKVKTPNSIRGENFILFHRPSPTLSVHDFFCILKKMCTWERMLRRKI